MTDHIRTRKALRDIADVAAFDGLLNTLTISEQDKQLMQLHYIEHQDFRFIGDVLGLSESTVRKHHRRILRKITDHL